MTTDESLVRTLLLVIVAILLLPILAMALVMPLMGLWGWGHMWNGAGGTWLLVSIVPLLVVLAVGYLLYALLGRSPGERTDPALEELRTAYARGDLTDEEFENRRERLERER